MSDESTTHSVGSASGGKKQIAIYGVIFVVAAGGGFFGGMQYQKSKLPAGRQFTFNGQAGVAGAFARGGARGVQNGMGFSNGEVMSKDANSVTLKLMNGGSQVVILAPSTQYRMAVDGSANDVAVGKQVTVTGSTNSDGSLTAQSIQIRDATGTPQSLPPQ